MFATPKTAHRASRGRSSSVEVRIRISIYTMLLELCIVEHVEEGGGHIPVFKGIYLH